MKKRLSLQVSLVAAVLLLALAAGCSRARSDSEVANEVRGKIVADSNVAAQQVDVRAENGVVTLSGTVESEMARSAAANSAAQVEGVKTVVNNLTVEQAPEMSYSEPPAAPVQKSQRSTPPATRKVSTQPPPGRHPAQSMPEIEPVSQAAPVQAAAPAPAPVRRVTIPQGTTLSVRLVDALDSEKNKAGDLFLGTLDVPLHVDGEVVVPAYAEVEGRVVDAKDAGHFSGRSELVLQLTRVTIDGRSYELQTTQWSKQGASQGKRTAGTVGGGAAAGAILGGIIGGGKGAAIGAAAGAGAGTGVQAATGGKPIRLPSETVVSFQLEGPLSVVPASASKRQQLPVN